MKSYQYTTSLNLRVKATLSLLIPNNREVYNKYPSEIEIIAYK